MTEGAITNWRHWPKPVQLSAFLMGGAMGLALVYTLLAGTPKPVLPSSALFEPVSVEQTLSSSRPELSSFDFIFRPVFALNRTPPVQPDLAFEDEAALAAAAEAEAVVVGSIDGFNLLGIFGSGDVEGVIIRLDNGERKRLTLGQSISGWALRAVDPRSARFTSTTGAEAHLEMVFSRRQPTATDRAETASGREANARRAPDSAVRSGGKQPAAANGAGQEAMPQRVTFETIYGGPAATSTDK